jgi:hypothetical protein
VSSFVEEEGKRSSVGTSRTHRRSGPAGSVQWTLVLHGERSSLMSNIAQLANPVIVCTVAMLLGGMAISLASQRSRVSATWGLGVGLVLLATTAFVMAISVFVKSTGLGLLGLLSLTLDGLGEAPFLPIAMAYAFAVPSSRWAGMAAARYSVLVFLPNSVVSPIAASLEGLAPALVFTGIVTLVGGGRARHRTEARPRGVLR